MAACMKISMFATFSSNFCVFISRLCLYMIFVCIFTTCHSTATNIPECKSTALYECVYMHHDFFKSMNFDDVKQLHIYCYTGEMLRFRKLWQKPQVTIATADMDYHLYHGDNATDVHNKYMSDLLPAGWDLYRKIRGDRFTLSPFNHSCIGLWADTGVYTLFFVVKRVDIWLVMCQLIGVFLFVSAKRLSKNTIFHYSAGAGIGVVASLVIVAFVLSRFIPKKTGVVAFLLSSCSVTLYLLCYITYRIESLLRQYYHIIAAYVIMISLLSFAVCYMYGPVTNARRLNLIQWLIQLLGCGAVFLGSQIPQVSVVMILVLIGLYNFPRSLIGKLRFWWYIWHPPVRKLLSDDEYMREGEVETQRALDELRSFCQSPDCDAWRTVSRLKDPQRFSGFVKGSTHITDSELLEYDSYLDEPPRLTLNDSSDSDFSDIDTPNHVRS